MNQSTTTTLRRYYASFKSVSGILAAIFGGLPFVSQFLPGNAYTFPPIGDVEPAARVGLVVLAFAMTFGIYFWVGDVHRPNGYLLAILLGISMISLLSYLALYNRFVRRVDIPTRDSTVYVSIGYERTSFAISTFGSTSDWEMLRARGADEEQIQMLWTSKSLIVTRLTLYVTYSLVVLALVGAFSIGVLRDTQERAISERKPSGIHAKD